MSNSSGEKPGKSINNSAKEAHLRELIVERLRETAESDQFMVDRERCFAEAADRVLATLKQELFEQEESASPGDPGPDPTAPTSLEKTYEEFMRIRDDLVEQVRLGYLAGNLQMLKALGAAVAVRDTGSGEHNYRVTLYAVKLAEALGQTNGAIQTLIKGSFLHDIGKISISDNILLKPDRLSEAETEAMQSHPGIGAGILSEVKWLEDTYEVVMSHHEKWDGTGYPRHFKGEQIPFGARIFAIVDVFDALISERPYKPAYPFDEVIAYMMRHRGSHFDPNTLDKFLEIASDLHNSIAHLSMDQLEKMIAEIIDKHFQIDLSSDRYRSKFSEM